MAVDSITIEIGIPGEVPRLVELNPGQYVIGRDESCELFIDEERISRRHLRLTVTAADLLAEDLDSSNGSYVNGLALCERVPLRPGELLILGADAVFVRMSTSADSESSMGTPPPQSRCGTSHASSDGPPEVNLFDANYVPGAELARGGMGAVNVADDRNVQRTVAIKKLLSAARQSDDAKQRFLQEARVMGHLEHPNIVPMHELGLDEEGQPYYTMKLIRGTNLQAVFNQIKAGDEQTLTDFPLRALLEIFVKICDAMAFAHAKGVIHRDLKPDNVMLGEFGEVLVADWGLAKILPDTPMSFLLEALEEDSTGGAIVDDSEDSAMQTMEGSVMGTPNYMAPEQAKGATSEIDRLSDIFSLGGILYTILTLRPPVHGATLSEVLDNMRNGYIAPPIFYNRVKSAKLFGRGKRAQEEVALLHCPESQIPEALSRVTMRAMKLERKKRYQSVTKLQRDVQAWLHGYATAAEQANFRRQLELFVQRNRLATLVGGLVFLIGTTLLGWALVSDHRARSAMDELQPAVPLIESDLQKSVDLGDFDRALERLNTLVKLLPENPDYRRQRSQMLQSNFRFAEAANEFKAAGVLAGERDRFLEDVELSRKLAKSMGSDGLPDLGFESFINHLDQQKRFTEARVLRRARIDDVAERVASLREEYLNLSDEKANRIRQAAASLSKKTETASPSPDSYWDFEFDAKDRISDSDLTVSPGAKVEDGFLKLTGKNGNATSQPLAVPVEEFTLELWGEFEFESARSATFFWVRSGDNHNALRYNLRGKGQLAYQWRRSSKVDIVGEKLRPAGMTQYVLSVGRDGVRVFVNGQLTRIDGDARRVTDSFIEFPKNHASIMIGHSTFGDPVHFKGQIAEARFFQRIISDNEVAALYRANPLAYPAARLDAAIASTDQDRIKAVDARLSSIWSQVGPINRLVASAKSGKMLASYREWMKEQGATDEACNRLGFRDDGRLGLSLRRLKLTDISWLRNIPLSFLDISGNPVADLSPLRGMELRELHMRGTKVTRLDPLANMPLELLEAENAPVTDLHPLKGMPLRRISLIRTRVSDLSPLEGAPVQYLNVGHTLVRDLSPLSGMPLRSLVIGGCEDISDLSPLKGLPLIDLHMWSNTGIKDLRPLIGSPLEIFQATSMPDLTGWNALAGKPLKRFQVSYGDLSDYSMLAGAPLESISLEWTKGTNFSVFKSMPLETLRLTGCNIRDLRELGRTDCSILDLSSTPISDLSPLADSRIDNLQLQRCTKIRDLSPLLNCRVRRLILPPEAKNVELLRNHPHLKRIAWRLSSKRSNPAGWANISSKEEFWKQWDAGRRKP